MKIYKYELELDLGEPQTIQMCWPAGFCHFGMQNGVPCIWATADFAAGKPVVERGFFIVGTGHEIPDPAFFYRGTAMHQQLLGVFVWHLFETI